MKLRRQNALMLSGMIGALCFAALDILGKILWKDYDPVTTYISLLTADGAPDGNLMRIFLALHNFCLVVFTLSMTVRAFRKNYACLKTGYSLLLVTSLCSLIGFGVFPVSVDFLLNKRNLIHVAITVAILLTDLLALALIAAGYLKQEKQKLPGLISLVTALLFSALNGWHLVALLNAQAILGIIQRLSIYTYLAFIAAVSWINTFHTSADTATKTR